MKVSYGYKRISQDDGFLLPLNMHVYLKIVYNILIRYLHLYLSILMKIHKIFKLIMGYISIKLLFKSEIKTKFI